MAQVGWQIILPPPTPLQAAQVLPGRTPAGEGICKIPPCCEDPRATAPQDGREAGVRGKDGRTDGRKEHSRVLFWSDGGNIDAGRGESSTLICFSSKSTGYLKNRSEGETERILLPQLIKFNAWQTATPEMGGRKTQQIPCPLATLPLNVAPKSQDSSV